MGGVTFSSRSISPILAFILAARAVLIPSIEESSSWLAFVISSMVLNPAARRESARAGVIPLILRKSSFESVGTGSDGASAGDISCSSV